MRRTPLSRASGRSKVRSALDNLFRMFILHRAGGACERCGRAGGAFADNKEGAVRLQVAHFKSRRIEHTRWDPDNAACLCKGCHFQWGHHQPDQFVEWWTARIGASGIARLDLIWRTLRGRPRADLALTRLYLLSLPGVKE